MESRLNVLGKKWKRILLVFCLIVITFVIIVVAFISPITKYLVEKYDTKYFGRQIEMDWAYVNPFTGYVHFDELKVYEQNNDTIFFSSEGISANIAMLKLVSKTYEISSLVIDQPKGAVIREEGNFNFTDIIQKFAPKTDSAKTKEPLHLNILDVEIINGEVYMRTPNTPINYSFKKINFTSNGKYWDRDTISGKLDLSSGIGSGDIKANFTVNLKNLDYYFKAIVNQLNLKVMRQYINDLAGYGNISGELNANIYATGNFNDLEKIDGKGKVMLAKFHFGKDSLTDYITYDNLILVFNRIAPSNKIYDFDTVRFVSPHIVYEKYDYLDNIQNIFGKGGAKIDVIKNDPKKFNMVVEVSTFVRTIFKNFFISDYKIKYLALENGNIEFNDYSGNEKFTVSLNPLNITADSVDRENKKVKINLQSAIKPYGSLNAQFRMDADTNTDFHLTYKIKQLPASIFNPYLKTYTSFPLDKGVVELFGNWNFHNEYINSNNHFVMVDSRLSDRVKTKGARWLPLPFVMFLVRDKGNVIDYEIPITGSLKDPKFHIKEAVADLFQNIFVKPATSSYNYKVKNIKSEIENPLSLTWSMHQYELDRSQEKWLFKISKFLKNNPQASLLISPMNYADKEKENILFFEAKKKYYQSNKSKSEKYITENDSIDIEQISVKDPYFVKYINKVVTDTMLFTIQEKCYRIVGEYTVNSKYNHLIESRQKIVRDFFQDNNTGEQIKFTDNKNVIPFNGFSYFKIFYKGDVPKDLIETYGELKDLKEN